jgi:hypothetical protein
VVLIHADKVYRALPDLLHDVARQQLLDRFHEGRLAVPSLGSPFGGPVVETLDDWVRRDHLLHVVPELAEKLMVQTDGPVL